MTTEDKKHEIGDELRDEIEEEMDRSYIAGIIDGVGTITVSITKDSDYKMNYALNPRVKIVQSKPFAIQLLDDWCANNGVFSSVRQYEDRYEFTITRTGDLIMFLEKIAPYIQNRVDEFHLMLDEILPRLQSGQHNESKEGFIETVGYINELRQESLNSSRSKYTVEYFKDEWDLD